MALCCGASFQTRRCDAKDMPLTVFWSGENIHAKEGVVPKYGWQASMPRSADLRLLSNAPEAPHDFYVPMALHAFRTVGPDAAADAWQASGGEAFATRPYFV